MTLHDNIDNPCTKYKLKGVFSLTGKQNDQLINLHSPI